MESYTAEELSEIIESHGKLLRDGKGGDTMSDTIELLPCPFCASADIDNLTINPALAARFRRYMMLCRSCGCCSDKHKTKKEARMHWNTRAQPAEQQDESWQAGYDKGRQDGANRRPDDVKQLELRNSELQSELNDRRETICRLLIELDAVPKWISVEERLPELDVPVWLHHQSEGIEGGIIYMGVRSSSTDGWMWEEVRDTPVLDSTPAGWEFEAEFFEGNDPTHWIPLPEFPVSLTDEGKSDDDMRISLISDENIVEVPCSTHPDAPHGFNRNASHCADRYVCDCEGWVPPVADEGNA